MPEKIKIMTDSVADIPPDLLEKWNIGVIPCYVNFDNESYADDGIELDRDEFYKKIPSMKDHPSTAAPPPALAEDILQDAFEGYDHLISINVPENLSATINNIRIGAQSLPEDKVTIIDSQNLSMGIGLQVLLAAEIAEETNDVDAVVDAVTRARDYIKLYAAFETLEYLERSGRVSSVVASVGSLLQIKPIVEVSNGEVNTAHRVRTFKRALNKLEDLLDERMPIDRLVVLHVANEEGAHDFRERISDVAPEDTPIIQVGPTLGTHIGPGAVGFVALSSGWQAS